MNTKATPSISVTPAKEDDGQVPSQIPVTVPHPFGGHKTEGDRQASINSDESTQQSWISGNSSLSEAIAQLSETNLEAGTDKHVPVLAVFDDHGYLVSSPVGTSESELDDNDQAPNPSAAADEILIVPKIIRVSTDLSVDEDVSASFDEHFLGGKSLLRANTDIGQTSHRRKRIRDRDLAYSISRAMDRNDNIGLDSEHPYLSDKELSALITIEKVQDTLPKLSIALGNFITNNKKIFSLILLTIKDPESRLEALQAFYDHDFTDNCLPVENLSKDGNCAFHNEQSEIMEGYVNKDDVTATTKPSMKAKMTCKHIREANAFHEWPEDQRSLRNFYDLQWSFLVPKFDKNQFLYDFGHKVILPFKKGSSQGFDQGHFSQVYKRMMLADHQEIIQSEDQTVPIAIKELKALVGFGYDVKRDWENECHALQVFNELNDEHIIKGICGFTQQSKHYIVMDWADGGSLSDFWSRDPYPRLKLNPSRIMEILRQLRGLANALHRMHHYHDPNSSKSDMSWRHGDLKPSNILRFKNSSNWLGTLKLADLGRAKQHRMNTRLRKAPTSELFVSRRYEAPETTYTMLAAPRSRLYDIWAFGCILLDFVVWLLYGLDEVNKNFAAAQYLVAESPYWMFDRGSRTSAKLRDTVSALMQDMLDSDIQCKNPSALRDLIILIRDKLLVVKLPIDSNAPTKGCRTNSSVLRDELDRIIRKAEQDHSYLFRETDRSRIIAPIIGLDVGKSRGQNYLDPKDVFTRRPSAARAHRSEGQTSYSHGFDDDWKFEVDNDFARKMILQSEIPSQLLSPRKASSLCIGCTNFDFTAPNFKITDTLVELHTQIANGCQFCSLRLQVAEKSNSLDKVEFELHSSGLTINGSASTVLSLYRTSDELELLDNTQGHIQIGLPRIPKAGSSEYVNLLQVWLKDCDENHPDCHSFSATPDLPTRLLDIGSEESPILCLIESEMLEETEKSSLKYVALSHPWGDPEKHSHVHTTLENIDKHKNQIPGPLPQTLEDSITISRALGIRYLWIDSLCIIQGPDGDFAHEAERMETVFSSAYCVVAATCAEGTSSGFLARSSRRQVDYDGEDNVVYFPYSMKDTTSNHFICIDEVFDNFEQDVSDGPLNKRGWVFQERALARRTIHFAKNQTYWECGVGIRCETLMKIRNAQQAFLGDPNFPKYGLRENRGGDIVFYESLYEQYSGLSFTHPEDRPVAIAGLEMRLIQALRDKGGTGLGSFGIFDEYWGRGLLWQRALDELEMKRLKAGITAGSRAAPSWSWMGHTGAITFMKLPPQSVTWLVDEVAFPWKGGRRGSTISYQGQLGIRGVARNFMVPQGDDAAHKAEIVFQDPSRMLNDPELKCLVIGRMKMKDRSIEQVRNYVLILSKQDPSPRHDLYERVGAGFIHGSLIEFNGPQLSVVVE